MESSEFRLSKEVMPGKQPSKQCFCFSTGVEVYANTNKPDSHSLFELEVNPRTELVKIQTPKGRYLTLVMNISYVF